MKKYLLLPVILLACLAIRAQNPDSIPNPGFELWYTTGWYEYPAGWFTNNSQITAATVLKDSTSYSGYLAMQLLNAGAFIPHAYTGFPIAHHPLQLEGYIKNELFSGDSAIFSVHIFYQQQLVDSGQLIVFGGINPNYTQFYIPISQNSLVADSCEISFYGGTIYLASIIIDDLTFAITTDVESPDEAFLPRIFPNPFSDQLTVRLPGNTSNDFVLTISDLAGKIVYQRVVIGNPGQYPELNIPPDQGYFVPTYGGEVNLSLKFLSSGIYSLNLNDGEKQITRLVIRN